MIKISTNICVGIEDKQYSVIPPFCMIEQRMIDSNAFREVQKKCPSALLAYTLIKLQLREKKDKKTKRIISTNRYNLKFPYAHAERYLSRGAFKRAIKALTKYGFIEITEPGGRLHNPAEYALSGGWINYKENS